MTRDEQREYNRRQFPELAAFVDDCRRVFGDGVRVLRLEVNGQQVAGEVDDDTRAEAAGRAYLYDLGTKAALRRLARISIDELRELGRWVITQQNERQLEGAALVTPPLCATGDTIPC